MTVRAGRLSLVRNTSALFGTQAVSLLVPLVTVPYLARVLRPEGWASVILAQALGAWLVLLLEFAFDLSGTRAVAHARYAPETMPAVVAQVQGAKLLLVPLAALLLGVAVVLVPSLRQNDRLLFWTFAFAIARGMSPIWFFQGIERVHWAASVDAIAKACAAFGVFLLVSAPQDGWRVIALQAVFSFASLLVLLLMMRRETRLIMPSISGSVAMLSRSVQLFGVRAASGLYIQANTLILAAFAGTASVAFFGGAERIVRASINLLQPLTQAFLPRLSHLSVNNPSRALRVVELCMLAVGGVGLVFGLSAFFGAPLLSRILLGPGYGEAIPIMRALSPLPVLVAINTVLGMYWAVPFGHERMLFRAVMIAGITNIALAFLFVPRWGAMGMTAAVVGAECSVTAMLGTLYLRRRGTTLPSGTVIAS